MKRTKTQPASLALLIEAIGESLTPTSAKRILEIKADKKLQARVKYLGECANEGCLTAEENAEYSEIIRYDTLVSTLQSKARRLLADSQGVGSRPQPRSGSGSEPEAAANTA